MIVVIQCAKSKRCDAGYFRTKDDRRILFVAVPASAPPSSRFVYARPDDRADDGISWRDHIEDYNKTPDDNRFGLTPAYKLYKNETYRVLVHKFGLESVMILSAGWGLIPAHFLTPNYDITFSASASPICAGEKMRSIMTSQCCRLEQMDPSSSLVGGITCGSSPALMEHVDERKIVFYNSTDPPMAPGCCLRRFETSMRTNWHYKCARYFAAGAVKAN